MSNPVTSPQSGFHLKSVQAAAPALGVDVTSLPIHSETEIEPAIAGFTRQSNGGLVIAGDSFLARNAKIVVDAADEISPAGCLCQPRVHACRWAHELHLRFC